MLRLVLLGIAIGIGSFAGCNQQTKDPAQISPADENPPPASAKKEPDREKWIDLPTEQWPQLVLTNDAVFEGHAPLDGASCFLIQDPDSQRVLFATSRHLLEIDIVKMDSIKRVWKAHPRTQPERSIQVGRAELAAFDVALFSLHEPPKTLPAQPLRVRQSPVTLGETVFLVGCPYEAGCRQNVYRGKVSQVNEVPYIEYTFEPAAELRGFSGGPIIDANGLAVGIFALKGRSVIPKNLGGAFLLSTALAKSSDARAGIQVTAAAADQIKRMIKASKLSHTSVLRLEWADGKVNLDMDKDTSPTDMKWESRGITVVTDPQSFKHCQGAVVDYEETKTAKGYRVDLAEWFRR